AERAWKAANDNPIFTYGNIPGNGGGNYDDANVQDEFFWAAAELYVTTGEQEYHDYVVKSPYFTGTFRPGQESAIYWGDVGVLGTMTLALAPDHVSADEQKTVQNLLIKIADNYVDVTAKEGYRVAMPPSGYSWGSNSNLLNNAMVMAYAYRLTNDNRYLTAIVETMDYVLGRNGLNFSFVAGYGTDAVQHPHHRFWADKPTLGYPLVPPGAIVGGPNAHPADPAAQVPEIEARATSKRYIDSMASYSTNEVAINWNAPLAWVAAFLDAHYNAS
ncbi:MAG: glycoside hydrolase family 9 protein, partial [Chloroflexota bacterium]